MAACTAETCTTKELLTTAKISATACGAPVQDRGPFTRRVYWSLFSLAVAAVALRFAARSPQLLDGPGYGWDDWTILAVLVFLIADNVGLEISTNAEIDTQQY